ncbi:MAG: metalloprotease PmbA, partial [Duganella sp.]
PHFSYTQDQLQQLARDVLGYAAAQGATDCAVDISEGSGLSVSVRQSRLETIEQNRDKGVGVTVYVGQRSGHASTADFSPAALKATVAAAWHIARFTAADDCAGLPDAALLETAPRDPQLFYPWDIDTAGAVALAQRAEAAAFAVDARVTNSEGASVQVQHSQFVAANSRGFIGGYPLSRHTLSVAPIAGRGARMQRDDWYCSVRDAARMAPPEAVGRYAAERALARLNARSISTRSCPVLFEAPLAIGLLGAYVLATSGGALYRKASFLTDSLGRQVMPSHLQIHEDPHVPGAIGSAPFDDEGVRTAARHVLRDGVVQGYFLSTYTARKLGMHTTGNAGGSHNLTLTSSLTAAGDDFPAMLRKLDTGLLVTEVLGDGVNYLTGDYSRGAAGFWVERGVIQYPVEEITIAGNMKDMLAQIVAVGTDMHTRGTKRCGSILIERMVVGGG